MKRRPGVEELPRWVACPLVADWMGPGELRPRSDPRWRLDRVTALGRYFDAVELWCKPRRLDWHEVHQGYPRFPEEAPDVDPAEGRP